MNTQKSLVGLFLLGLLAGCTSDWDPGRRATLAETTRAAERSSPPAAAARRVTSFAALPDRGELLAYDRSRAVRHRGAYTSHPIALSEAHAFRASHAGGELVVASPDGEMIRLGYERHVEHSDGNWTWIGRTAEGVDAVITFGEKAVFGTVPYRDQAPLQITTMAGSAWLVATDRSKLPLDLNRATTRNGKPDYLVPPRLSASLASSVTDIGMAAADVSPTAVANMVDVVLGYTNGYAAQLGGASQAVTRLNNLVEVGNQAINNSLVSRRLRLVRTVQVNYADATDNATALEELTGYRDGNDIPVPAALQPLRTARDQYGGDLVSLVRAFRAPENDGCGIAWLIGGGQTPYTTAYASFAYSVVSDGTDADESDGNNYLCRVESLVHELGHNLGQAHNVDDSGDSGAHPYSYGYREASSTGFFTVMAYPNTDSQVAIRYFANPTVTVSGRPTGVANASDNTRSLNLTMPVAANFRAAVVPAVAARNDVNGDGRSDLLLRYLSGSSGSFGYWAMNGASVARTWSTSTGVAYRVAATGDFNGDRRLDIVWTSAQRDVKIWFGNGTSFGGSQHVGTYPAGWSLIGAGDINGDGKSDLLLRYFAGTSGKFGYWVMNGASVTRTWSTSTSTAYRVAATGDFNRDGRLDIVWTSAQRDLKLWLGNGTSFGASQNIGNYPAGWSLIGAGDIDGDGRSDLLLRYLSGSGGKFGYWIMSGATVVRTWSTSTGTAYSVATTGDFNGDGRLDIVWTSAQRDVKIWFGNGNSFGSSQNVRSYPVGWTLLNH